MIGYVCVGRDRSAAYAVNLCASPHRWPMTSVITWYDVLGVLPDATPDDIREAWQARQVALQAGTLAGASPEVLTAADRARQAVQEAWRVLADPAARES